MDKKNTLTVEQCRAARAWLGWKQDDLAAASGIAKRTIADFERAAAQPQLGTLTLLRQAFEKTDQIEFIDSGLRLHKLPSSE